MSSPAQPPEQGPPPAFDFLAFREKQVERIREYRERQEREQRRLAAMPVGRYVHEPAHVRRNGH